MRYVKFARVKTKQATMQSKQSAYNVLVGNHEGKKYKGLLSERPRHRCKIFKITRKNVLWK
jgi:hypothetical protein